MAPALVQVASSTGNTVTVTLGAATTAGNCLVACIMLGSGGSHATVSSVKIGGSADNWSQLEAVGDLTTGAEQLALWIDPNCTGGQTSVVMVPTVANTNAMYVFEFSGIATSNPFDQSGTADSGGSTSGPSWSVSTTGATSQASELAVGCVYGYNQTITGPSSPWVNEATLNNSNRTLQAGYNILSSTGTQTYSGSLGGATFNGQIIVTLKASGGGTPHTSTPSLTVTPAFANTKGLGVVPALTVTPARKAVKGLGILPALTVTPARTVKKGLGLVPKLTVAPARTATTQAAHVSAPHLTVTPALHATGVNPHVYPHQASGGGSSMLKRAMLWADL